MLRCRYFRCIASIWTSELVQLLPAGTCCDIFLPGIRVELVGIQIPVTSVGGIFPVVSVLFLFGFKIRDVCVWDCRPALVPCCDFWALIYSAIIDWIVNNSSLLWLIGLFAVIARVIVLGRIFNWERISVFMCSLLRYYGWPFLILIKNWSTSRSVKRFEKLLKQAGSEVF